MFNWTIDHYEVVICRSNGLNYTYICHSEEEVQAYVEEYGIQVASIKQVNKANVSDII